MTIIVNHESILHMICILRIGLFCGFKKLLGPFMLYSFVVSPRTRLQTMLCLFLINALCNKLGLHARPS